MVEKKTLDKKFTEGRKKLVFWKTEITKKPVIIKFKRSDGSIVRFKATKIVKKPKKVVFYSKRRDEK